jgi:Fe-S-cluster containining protein
MVDNGQSYFIRQECKCEECKNSCAYKPGWFLPGEIEKAAQYLMMSEQEFFDQYLGVDWYEDFNDIFVLAPAITSMYPGEEYPANPKGQCVFFHNGLCNIHSVKPYECIESYHADTYDISQKRHSFVAQTWIDKQDYICTLLGRDPEKEGYAFFDAFLW